jgi:RNA polymerase sigma factor (sigma-70 family)
MLGIGALHVDRPKLVDRGDPDARRAGRATDDEAGALFEAYGERIRGYIAFRVRGPEDAEDLASEVFRRLVSGPVPADPTSRPAWLFQVAHNIVIDHYRRRRSLVPLGSLLDRPDDAPGLPEQAIHDERIATVDRALATLGGRQRAAIYLRFHEDLDYATIGTVMGIPAVSVRTLVHRGLKRIATEMAEAD